jgi:hypothetical protein
VLRKLRALDARQRALIAYGVGWVLIARAALTVPRGSLPRCQRWVDRLAARLPAPPRCTRGETAWAITAAARRIPGTRCLDWALALRALFAQQGIASDLRIGVAADGAGAIRAHAWIVAGGETWSWGDPTAYSVLRPRPAVGT